MMITKQSNNIIPTIHQLVTDEYGENYWFNGCAKYVMECLGEPDYDYWFYAGLTGDVFTQHYAYSKYAGDALSSYMMEEDIGGNPVKFTQDVFAKCGYAATYVSNQDLQKNSEMYLSTLVAYIDKGIPVIAWETPLVGVFVGYEDYGKVLLYITGNKEQPERVSLERIIHGEVEKSQYEYRSQFGGWIFVGEKKESRPLAEIYRSAVRAIPQLQNIKTDTYCFGAEAFRSWARDIENGKFDGMKPEDFDTWAHYTNYVCVLATNGSCCHEFLKRARELNPDMEFLEEVSARYRRIAEMWGGDNSRNDPDSLEALGGGFNIALEVLQDKKRRGRIAAKIREFAKVTDEIVQIVTENMAKEMLVCERWEYVKLGKMRFIGIDAWCGREMRSSRGNGASLEGFNLESSWDDLWTRSSKFMPTLDALAEEYGAGVKEPCSMMHHNGKDVDTENHFLAGRFFKSDTPVPEGYDYYDVPTEWAAYASYTTDEYDGALGSAYFATRDKILSDGVGIPYPQAYWHAEVYTDGRPCKGNFRFAYMFSVDEKAGGLPK